MAADNYTSNINVNVNTGQSLAELRKLQAALSTFHQEIASGNRAAALSQEALNARLIQQINSIKGLSAAQAKVVGTTESFTRALERNKLSLREYARFSAAGMLEGDFARRFKVLQKGFAQERRILQRAYQDRVKLLQSQWISLNKPGAAGPTMGIRVTPTELKGYDEVTKRTKDFATNTQLAAQRMQFLNATLTQGSTQLVNWGKNTQWAGRQLMVGLTMPLIMLGTVSARTFREMEMATLRFRRVYGDLFTDPQQTEIAVQNIMKIGKEYAKLGIAIKDTMEMASDAAAAGFAGQALEAQVREANKLAVLGQIEQQQALETTISLQNAFSISTEKLAGTIDFLNAVENQTVVSLDDLTIAIPKAAPVIKQLGGDVKDLAFFLTAMKEGGINASEGANALKSGLASLINPTDKASEMLAGLGINIKGIVEANKGNIKAIVIGFAQALDTLDPLNRARAIEQLFGKFQFARLSTLFQNVVKDGSQAARVLDLMSASTEELAILSERELGKVEESISVQFTKTLEEVKLQLLPLGKLFLESLIPVLEFVGKIIERFNEFGSGTKKAILIFTVGFPAILMSIGLFANLLGNTIKVLKNLFFFLAKARMGSNVLGSSFNYMTNEAIENTSMTAAMNNAHRQTIEVFNIESAAAKQLALAYNEASAAAARLAATNPGFFVGGKAGAKQATSKLPKKLNRGTDNVRYYAKGTDSVPAMLTPGEAVIPAESAQDPANKPIIQAMIAGERGQGFKTGDDEVEKKPRRQTSRSSGGLTPTQKAQNKAALTYYTKNPNRVAGGIKAAETRRRNLAERESRAKEDAIKQQERENKENKQTHDKKMQQEERRARVGRIAGGVSAGLGVAAMGAFATGNTGAGTGLMAASLLANFAPILMNPYVAAAAAVAAMVGGIYLLNKVMEGRARKEEQFVRSVTANTEQMRKVSEITGKVGASQLMAKRREEGVLQGYNEAKRVGREFGGQFLGSDIGKEVYKAFNTNRDLYGTEKAAKQFALQLSAYISDGIMTAEQANSIAEQIAVNLGDVTVRTKIQGQLMMLIGPNGEDLLTSPLQTRLRMIRRSAKEGRKIAGEEDFASFADRAKAEDTFYQDEATGRIRMGAAQAAGYAASATEFAQAQLDAFTIYYDKLIDEQKLLKSKTKDLQEQEKIQEKINILIDKQIRGQKTLQEEVAKTIARSLKDFDKNIQQESGVLDNFILNAFKGRAKAEDAYFDALKGKIKDIYKGTEFETAASRVLDTLAKLSDDTFFKDQYKEAGFTNKRQAQQFEAHMQLLLANKVANPDQIETFMSMFQGNLQEGRAALNISLKTQGAAKTFELQSLLSTLGSGKEAKAIAQDYFVRISALPSPEFDKQAKAIAVLSELDGYEINMKFVLENSTKKEFKEFSDMLAMIETVDVTKDKKKIAVELEQIGFPKEGIKGLIEEWDTYYSKFPEETRKEMIQKYFTFYEFQSDFKDEKSKQEWMQRYAERKAKSASRKAGNNQIVYTTVYKQTMENLTGMSQEELKKLRSGQQTKAYFGKVNEILPETPTGDEIEENGKTASSVLDDLLKKLRDLRKNQILVTKGWAASSAALNKLFDGGKKQLKAFSGLKNDMRRLGADEDLISLIAGMDPDEFEKRKNQLFNFNKATGEIIGFKKTLKSLDVTLKEIALGEFVDQQQSIIATFNKQQIAMSRLRRAGVSAADSFTMVQDAALAAAIASNKLTKTELAKIVRVAKKAARALTEFNARESIAKENQEFRIQAELIKKLSQREESFAASQKRMSQLRQDENASIANSYYNTYRYYENLSKLTNEQINAILNSKDLQTILLNPSFDQTEFQLRLDQVLAQQRLEVEIKKLTIEGMEQLFAEAFNKAMDAFSAKETELQIKFKVENLENFKIISTAESEIANIRYQVDDLQAELKGLEDLETEINKTYDERINALDSVEKINQSIINQQKGQLTVADALSRGDIAAAARAAEELKAQSSQDALSLAKENLQKQREADLAALRTSSGKSRLEIEKQIKTLEDQIFQIEEKRLEPAQNRVRIAEENLKIAIEELTILDKNRFWWEQQQNAIDLAKTSSDKYLESLKNIEPIIAKIVEYWKEVTGNPTESLEVFLNGIINRNPAVTDSQRINEAINAQAEAISKVFDEDATQTTAGDNLLAQKLDELIVVARQIKDCVCGDKEECDCESKTPPPPSPTPNPIVTPNPVVTPNPIVTPNPVVTPEEDTRAKAEAEARAKAEAEARAKAEAEARAKAEAAARAKAEAEAKAKAEAEAKAKAEAEARAKAAAEEALKAAEEAQTASKLAAEAKAAADKAAQELAEAQAKTKQMQAEIDKQIAEEAEARAAAAAQRAKIEAEARAKAAAAQQGNTGTSLTNIITGGPIIMIPNLTQNTGSIFDGNTSKGSILQPTGNTSKGSILQPTSVSSNLPLPINAGGSPNPWGDGSPSAGDVARYFSQPSGGGGGGGFGSMLMLAKGGHIKPKYFANGALAKGTDTIPAMLSPGEFVIKRYAVDNFGVDKLKAINDGTYKEGSVYNYSISVNVKSDADANDIARKVITQIQQIDSQRIRGQRY